MLQSFKGITTCFRSGNSGTQSQKHSWPFAVFQKQLLRVPGHCGSSRSKGVNRFFRRVHSTASRLVGRLPIGLLWFPGSVCFGIPATVWPVVVSFYIPLWSERSLALPWRRAPGTGKIASTFEELTTQVNHEERSSAILSGIVFLRDFRVEIFGDGWSRTVCKLS